MLSKLISRTSFFRHGQVRSLTGKVAIDGCNIHYEQQGNGPKKVLLLPGALGSTRTDFAHQLDMMNREKFTLIAWDPPGYGQSRPPQRDLVDYYRKDAAAIAKLAQKLDIDRYSILGWSDGGITGLIVAANNPKSVEKLAIWGSNAYVSDGDRVCINAVKDMSKWSASSRTRLEEIYGVEGLRDLWFNFCEAYERFDDICCDDLAHIDCPVYLLHGDKDPMVAFEHVDYLMKNIKNIRVHRWPDGKHNIHMRYADEFNKLVEQFLIE